MANDPTMEQRLEQLAEARHKVELGGGEEKIEKQTRQRQAHRT